MFDPPDHPLFRCVPLPHHPAGTLQLTAHWPVSSPSVCWHIRRRAWSHLHGHHRRHQYSTDHRDQDWPGRPRPGHPSRADRGHHGNRQRADSRHTCAGWGWRHSTHLETTTTMTKKKKTWPLTSAGIAYESGGITFFPVQVSVAGQGGATLQTLSTQTLTGTLSVQSAVTKTAAKPTSSPLKKGSLSLFFRKVWLLLHGFMSGTARTVFIW